AVATPNEKTLVISMPKRRPPVGRGWHVVCFNGRTGIFLWEGKPMLSRNFARIRLGLAAATFSVLLLPSGASAIQIDWTTDNTIGPNQAQLQIRVACSGSSLICSGAGLSSAYQSALETSQLTGSGTSEADAVLETLSFDSFSASGTDVIFTMVPTAIQPGGNALVSDILLSAINAVTSALPGFTLDQD